MVITRGGSSSLARGSEAQMLRVALLLCCLLVEARGLAAYNYLEVDKLRAADAAAVERFGTSVAIDGDTVVVGAYLDDDGGTWSGSAYIFRTSDGGATYGQVAKLTADDAAANDMFGGSVAIDGATVVVGATQWLNAGSGVAYVLRTTNGGATYGQVAKLTADDAAAGDNFGVSVAIDGDTVVVGALYAGTGGAAYVLRTTDGGATYGQVAKLAASDAAAGDYFGVSVAIDGTTVVVAAVRKDGNTGAVYVFRTSDGGATYVEVAKLTAADAAASDEFGVSVAIDGDTVVVGAYSDDDAGSGSGAAYVSSRPTAAPRTPRWPS